MESVKSLAEYREATLDLNSSFKKPGLALNIGYDLFECCKLSVSFLDDCSFNFVFNDSEM